MGGRGTAHGWVDITIHAKKPHEGECDWRCMECRDEIDRIRGEVWEILKETKLIKHLYKYYDDMGYENYECTITVKLE